MILQANSPPPLSPRSAHRKKPCTVLSTLFMTQHHQLQPRQVEPISRDRVASGDAAYKRKFSPAPAFPTQQAVRDPGGRIPRDRCAPKCLTALTGFVYTRQSV